MSESSALKSRSLAQFFEQRLRAGRQSGVHAATLPRNPLRSFGPISLFLLVVALVVPTTLNDDLNLGLVNAWLLYAAVAVGFYLIFGISGQFAFSQAAFVGIGAYTAAWLTRSGLPPLLAVPIATLITATIAALLFMLISRTQHFYFVIATLSFAQLVNIVLTKWDSFSGPGGQLLNPKPFEAFGKTFFTQIDVFWLFLGLLAVVLLAIRMLERSPATRVAITVRDSLPTAHVEGISSGRVRAVMFILGSMIAGLAGAFFVGSQPFVSPGSFGLDLGIGIFLMVILGGSGSLWGGVIGAAFYVYIPHFLTDLAGYEQIVYGGLLVVVVVAAPSGLVGLINRFVRPIFSLIFASHARRSSVKSFGGGPASIRSLRASSSLELVSVAHLSVQFNLIKALSDVSVNFGPGITGVVGPNGSGKTTLLNAINGTLDEAARVGGRVTMGDKTLSPRDPRAARGAGCVRTFQTPQLPAGLTVLECVALGASDHRLSGIGGSWFRRPAMRAVDRARIDKALAALEQVGLGDRSEQAVTTLSYGQRRLVEIARCLAAEPLVAILDEPVAGLNSSEKERIAELLEALHQRGTAIIVIEHSLGFVSSICDRVIVLEQGKLIADGTPAAVWKEPAVIDAYLGGSTVKGEHTEAHA